MTFISHMNQVVITVFFNPIQSREIIPIMNKLIIIFVFITGISACGSDATSSKKHEVELIKSAHYFSSAWPKTFWQEFEKGDVPSELKKIKSDGFNTVVLTVPWRGFETGFHQAETQSDPVLYERLSFMLENIQQQGLFYMLRLGFPHDYTPETETDILTQCTGIYTDKKTQNQWHSYLKKINQVTQPYAHASAGTLVSWEDFWCPHFVFPNLSDAERLALAQKMNFGKWLKKKSLNIVKVLFKENDLDFELIKIPQPTDLSYVLYIEFIDDMLNQRVLAPVKTVFDDASIEIRVDKFPIKQGSHYTWIGHDLFLNETNHRGSYWAPFWGAANNGELLSADAALKTFEYFLKVVTHNGENTNHIIEQFNFYDNTPYFPNNANIKPDEIDDFLSGAAPLLKENTRGFGVWAYRDYQDNALYNSSFELGKKGWEFDGSAKIIKKIGDQRIELEAGTTLSQSFSAHERMMFVSSYKQLDLCLRSNQNTIIELFLMSEKLANWSISTGMNCTKIPATVFKQNKTVQFGLKAQSTVEIDELKLSGFTQKLGLYDANGNPGKNLKAYRKLNQDT